jgi:16S rRNA (cytosine967-C5)-methyltransferase
MNARAAAASALVRVLRDDAYGAAALSSELSAGSLESRDRGLATEILYGVLRTKGYLARRLNSFGKVQESDHVLLSWKV